MKFRKKPIVIEAIQFTGNNCFDCMHFMNRSSDIWEAELQQTDMPTINTPEGDLSTKPGDWIIKGINGEFYPCKPDIFEKSYEPVEWIVCPECEGDGGVKIAPNSDGEFEEVHCSMCKGKGMVDADEWGIEYDEEDLRG